MRMPLLLLAALWAALSLPRTVAAEPPVAAPGDTITWVKPLTEAYAQAQKDGKPLMVCINSERVDGGRVEAAAKELREVTYKDPAVVGRSRQFVCTFLTPEGSSDDFGELRARYAIEGLIVSPQHIFAFPDGKLIARHEYWPHGTGERAVKAMNDLMDQALAKHQAASSLPKDPTPPNPNAPTPSPDGPAAPPAPPPPEGDRAAWRAELIKAIVDGPSESRKEALRRLLLDDKDGANVKAIVEVLPKLEEDKNLGAQLDVVRALGRPGLKAATACLVERLDAKDDELRGNVAVSLEYIGDPEAVDGLKGRLDREKVELIQCHVLRALGRCGAGEKGVRATLDRRITSAKTETLSCAAIIGLAHFEKDGPAARIMEDQLQKVGPPSFGRRGGQGQNSLKRAFLAWGLAEIGDAKSAEFMRKKMLPSMDNTVGGPLLDRVREFYVAVAEVCEGKAESKAVVEGSTQWVLGFYGNTLRDDARRGRDDAGYIPKADWEAGPAPGGGQGPGGGMPGGPGGAPPR